MQKEMAERQAVCMLMKQWVSENIDDVTSVLLDIVPFICGECNTDDLQKDLNVVNITFANIALDVIRTRNEQEAEGYKREPLSLPADAMEMQNALYDLSRFFKKFNRLGCLLKHNSDMPAFRMAISTFDQVDSM